MVISDDDAHVGYPAVIFLVRPEAEQPSTPNMIHMSSLTVASPLL